MLDQGHQAGILRPSQKQLAQGIFSLASRPITEFTLAPGALSAVAEGADREHVIAQARQSKQAVLPVHASDDPERWIGYLNVPEVYIEDATEPMTIRPLVEIAYRATHLSTLMKLQRVDEELGRVIGQNNETLGFITPQRLCGPLFEAEI